MCISILNIHMYMHIENIYVDHCSHLNLHCSPVAFRTVITHIYVNHISYIYINHVPYVYIYICLDISGLPGSG